jgi:hypothetical protein
MDSSDREARELQHFGCRSQRKRVWVGNLENLDGVRKSLLAIAEYRNYLWRMRE